MNKGGYVYIMSDHYMGTLYTGVTSDLIGRVHQHKNHLFQNSFTGKYNLNKLVYYEFFPNIEDAIIREKQMKKWNRNWKLRVIIDKNPDWNDLWGEITDNNNWM